MKKLRKIVVLLIVFSIVFSLNAFGNAELVFSENPDAVEQAAKSVFMLEVYDNHNTRIAIGSGFIAFESNIIVTNYHVIEGASYIIANSDDNERHIVASIGMTDEHLDIAFLLLDAGAQYEPLVLETDSELKRAMRVVAIGSPAGLMNTISIGNISAFYHDASRNWIQFTAPISSGSSGGPLLNDHGKVIGVTTATYASAQNVNMAVKAEDVVNLYESWTGKPGTHSLSSAASFTNIPNVTNTEQGTTTVYVSKSGKKYHLNPSCSRMKNPVSLDLLDAIQQGYEPCGICYR